MEKQKSPSQEDEVMEKTQEKKGQPSKYQSALQPENNMKTHYCLYHPEGMQPCWLT